MKRKMESLSINPDFKFIKNTAQACVCAKKHRTDDDAKNQPMGHARISVIKVSSINFVFPRLAAVRRPKGVEGRWVGWWHEVSNDLGLIDVITEQFF